MSYNSALPHKGYFINCLILSRYAILKKWRDRIISKQSPSIKDFMENSFKDNNIKSDHFPSSYFVYSSNVDGLFEKSGIQDFEILEIHGNSQYLQCQDGVQCTASSWCFENPRVFQSLEELPRCPKCDKICRPSVLMFNDEEWVGFEGESSVHFDIYDIWEEAVEDYLLKNPQSSIVLLEIGCGDRVREWDRV